MEQVKTIQTVAQCIYDNMEYKERKDKSSFCCLKNRDIQWQTDIIHEAHLDRMPSDDIYDRINTILSNISDVTDDATDDDIRESIQAIEPDCYTSDLTKWLNSDNRNVYYLDEAISIGVTDGFQLLAIAQSTYIQEIGNALISAIQEYIDSID